MQKIRRKPIYGRWWFWSLLSFPICVFLSVFGLSVDTSVNLFMLSIPGIPLGFFLWSKISKRIRCTQQVDADDTTASDKPLPSIIIEEDSISPTTLPRTATSVENKTISARVSPEIARIKKYAVIDVETTGLDRTLDRIVEIGIVIVEKNTIVEKFETLVNPERSIPAAASKVHGIYNEDVVHAPTYATISAHVAELLDGRIVIGHNVSFDIAFINRLLSENHLSIQIQSLDTVSLTRALHPELSSCKLDDLRGYFGLPTDGAHSALSDAVATHLLFERLRSDTSDKISGMETEKERLKQERADRCGASPLFDVPFVFTGEFEEDRFALENRVEKVGGLVRTCVSGKTRYLVAGDTSNYERKVKLNDAYDQIEKGSNLEIISERDCIALVEEAERCLS